MAFAPVSPNALSRMTIPYEQKAGRVMGKGRK